MTCVMDKIVIIEDDPGIRTVLRLALKGAGYSSLYEADRGDDGLALVLHEQPALVLLDLMLPGLDGLSVCREIRRTESVSTTPTTASASPKPARNGSSNVSTASTRTAAGPSEARVSASRSSSTSPSSTAAKSPPAQNPAPAPRSH